MEIGNGEEHQEANHCPENDASKKDNQQQPDIENNIDNDLLEGSKEAHKAFLEFFEQLDRSFYPHNQYSRSARRVGRAQDLIQEYEARMPLKWRIGQARKLSFVITAYFRLLEDR